MGQCSTLPAEARQSAASSPDTPNHVATATRYHHQERDDRATGRRNRYHNMADSSDNNSTTPHSKHYPTKQNNNGFVQMPAPPQRHPTSQAPPYPAGQYSDMQVQPMSKQPPPVYHHHQRQYQHPTSPSQQERYAGPHPNEPEPMEMEDTREDVPVKIPESAVRTRCYKLNLDSDTVGLSGGVSKIEGKLVGPFDQNPPPPLTESISSDSSMVANPTMVAIRTAQIFRGITVGQDGTVLTQNARASRSNRNKNKRSEKSRQAAKIDKANDLVEESVLTGKAPNSDQPANLVSLVIIGEYDDMNYLVRDGSKKLKDADGLPDDALLAVNKTRSSSTTAPPTLLSPTRKRVSPHVGSNNGHSSNSGQMFTPLKSRHTNTKNMPNLPQSAPPKLKGHPRDRPRTRRLSDDSSRNGASRRSSPVQESCSMFGPPRTVGGHDSDWSGALGLSGGLNSFWNCGSAKGGNVSPTQEQNGKATTPPPQYVEQRPVNEGRNESSHSTRYGRTVRTDPPEGERVTVVRA